MGVQRAMAAEKGVADRGARVAPRPVPAMLALQRAAGNRAVAGLVGARREAVPVVQRRPWLDDQGEAIYREKNLPTDLAYVGNHGKANRGVFIDYGRLEGMRTLLAEHPFIGAESIAEDQNTTIAKKFTAAVGTVWREQPGPGQPLAVIDPWTNNEIGVILLLINAGKRPEPLLRNEGGGSRLPHAEGTLYVDAKTWANKADALVKGLGVDLGEVGEYKDVDFVEMDPGGLVERKVQAQDNGEHYRGGNGFLYVSSVTARPRARRQPKVAGSRQAVDNLTKQDIAELNLKYEAIRPTPVTTGWVEDLSGGREGSQDTAMKNWSAYGAAAFHNQHRAGNGGLVPLEADNWEWLHIRGAQIGGPTDATNLLAGTFAANSQMIPYETKLQKWHTGNHGKIWAQFTAEARDLVLAEKITIEVASTNHPDLGTIPDTAPLRVAFYPLSGLVVDRLTGHLAGRSWREDAEKRGKMAQGAPPRPSTGQGEPSEEPDARAKRPRREEPVWPGERPDTEMAGMSSP